MTPYDFDIHWLLALNFDAGAIVDALMYGISWKYTWVPLYAGVLWWIAARRGIKTALLFLVITSLTILCADQTATFFKNALPKLRPTHYDPIKAMVHTVYDYRGGSYGTVSSHAANSIVFAILSATVIRKQTYTLLISLWVLAVCYSRIYLGVHYPMDIIFGLIEGAIWATIWFMIYKVVTIKLKI